MTNSFAQWFPPKKGRMHEACGPGATFFAVVLAARLGGDVIWVRQAWQSSEINPVGFSAILPPARLLTADAQDQTEVLAVAEEALRAGVLSVVVLEVDKPLSLTAGRRLQLAAKEGKSTGLCLIREGMGSNAAESRWRCTPVFDGDSAAGDSTLQRWALIKNKSGTLEAWHVRWDTATHRLRLVSPAGKRPGSEGAPG